MNTLAIVIPAYKGKFLNATLASLNSQTNRNFCVYIGDDNSPDDLKSICDKFSDDINIKYSRFAYNIGAENLVNQWRRCVELTEDEKWIWLFSDDDLVDKTCVANFYTQLNSGAKTYDIYRFNSIVIDSNNNVLSDPLLSPHFESSEEMAYNILLGKRGNVMPDQIFSRQVYDACGGFVFTKFAQGADWATSILFSKKNGMVTIPDSYVYWRYSGDNISAKAHNIKNETTEGHLQFIEWVANHFHYLKSGDHLINYQMISDAIATNLIMIIIEHYKGFNNNYTIKLALYMHRVLHFSKIKILKTLIFIKINSSYKANKIRRAARKIKSLLVSNSVRSAIDRYK